MSDLAQMPLDTSAYLSDTGHLSTLEHGAYLLILMAMWRSADGAIPGDDQYLARATRMMLGRWKRIAPTIRALLKAIDGGRVTQKRVQKERRHQQLITEKTILTENQNSEAKSLKNKGTIPETAVDEESASFLLLTSESDSGRRKKENKKVRGHVLPNDWRPADAERLYGRTVLRLTDAQVDCAAERMRRWARTNAHRAVAKKTDWDLTFRNWLDRFAEELISSRPKRNGAAGARLNRMENDHDDEPADHMDYQRALSPGPYR